MPSPYASIVIEADPADEMIAGQLYAPGLARLRDLFEGRAG